MKQYSNTLTNKRTQYSLYKATHPLFNQWMKQKHTGVKLNSFGELILGGLPTGPSVWIDSFGKCFNDYKADIFSVESIKYVEILRGISGVLLAGDVLKYNIDSIDPTSIVFYDSPILTYRTPDDYIGMLLNFKAMYPEKMIVVKSNFIYIDFNRLKYTYNNIYDYILSKIPNSSLKSMGMIEAVITF